MMTRSLSWMLVPMFLGVPASTLRHAPDAQVTHYPATGVFNQFATYSIRSITAHAAQRIGFGDEPQ